jgi:outer membrane receptor for ferrienterochelin and colicin
VGTQPEQVTVSGDVNEIDNTTSTVSGLVARQSLTELPLAGRDLFKAAVFAPGVAPTPNSAPSMLSNGKAGQISIDGMRPSWTDVLIDGMDANDPVEMPPGRVLSDLARTNLTDVISIPLEQTCLSQGSLPRTGTLASALQRSQRLSLEVS